MLRIRLNFQPGIIDYYFLSTRTLCIIMNLMLSTKASTVAGLALHTNWSGSYFVQFYDLPLNVYAPEILVLSLCDIQIFLLYLIMKLLHHAVENLVLEWAIFAIIVIKPRHGDLVLGHKNSYFCVFVCRAYFCRKAVYYGKKHRFEAGIGFVH
jgi:hypothetical protein